MYIDTLLDRPSDSRALPRHRELRRARPNLGHQSNAAARCYDSYRWRSLAAEVEPRRRLSGQDFDGMHARRVCCLGLRPRCWTLCCRTGVPHGRPHQLGVRCRLAMEDAEEGWWRWWWRRAAWSWYGRRACCWISLILRPSVGSVVSRALERVATSLRRVDTPAAVMARCLDTLFYAASLHRRCPWLRFRLSFFFCFFFLFQK